MVYIARFYCHDDLVYELVGAAIRYDTTGWSLTLTNDDLSRIPAHITRCKIFRSDGSLVTTLR